MRNTIVFCSWALQIVLEWLHQGRDNDLSAIFLNFGAGDFPFKFFFKSASKSCFFSLAPRSGFGCAISHTVARRSSVFCNSISRYRIVVAASRLLVAAAACVILLSLAAGHCKSYWNGCIKAVIVICQHFFSRLAFGFSFEKILKKCFQIVFCSLCCRDPVLELHFSAAMMHQKVSLCKIFVV